MEDWMKQSVSQLKRLVKSRAGRIAELQMEIKILEGVIEKKVREGDLGSSASSATVEKAVKAEAPLKEAPKEEVQEEPVQEAPKEPEQSKITEKSSDHAFKEIE